MVIAATPGVRADPVGSGTGQATTVRLCGFRRADPPFVYANAPILEWMAAAYAAESGEPVARWREALTRFAAGPADIAQRRLSIPDFGVGAAELFTVPGQSPGWDQRDRCLTAAGARAFETLFPAGSPAPSTLIHVMSTNPRAPSDAHLHAARCGWRDRTRIILSQGHECAAGIAVLGLARDLVLARRQAEPSSGIDVAHTEYCSLHFDPARRTPDALVGAGLFGDAAVAYRVHPVADDRTDQEPGFTVIHTAEEVLTNASELVWMRANARSLQAQLGRALPQRIAAAVGDFHDALLAGAGWDPALARQRAIYAVHPGGPAILNAVRDGLGITEHQVRQSRAILREYGNPSSAGLPLVWSAIAADPSVPSGMPVISLAFGPGLVLAGALLIKA